jgi:hypothetical protein
MSTNEQIAELMRLVKRYGAMMSADVEPEEVTPYRKAIEAHARKMVEPAPQADQRAVMQMALECISWQCFGDCRVGDGPIPTPSATVSALRQALAAKEQK